MVHNFFDLEFGGYEAFISNQTAKNAAIFNDWKGFNSINVDLEPGSSSKVGLSQSNTVQLEEKGLCQTYEMNEGRPQCLIKNAFQDGIARVIENCPNPCTVPVLESHLINENTTNWNYCRNDTETECLAVNAISKYNPKVQTCPQSCYQVEFAGKMEYSDSGSSYPELTIYFESMTAIVYEELLLFDLPSFIGNIGGSLGLFIVFSYLDFATKITNTFISLLSKRK